MSEKPNYYSVIPANVRYDKSLKANEKLLYGEVTALSNQKGYCWAVNNYFADLFDVSKETVSRWISNLEKNGYVRTELIYGNDKQVKERRIYIADPLLTKKSIPPLQNNQYPIDENVKENITSINTTSTNNDNDNDADLEKENSKNKKQKPLDSKVVHQFYQQNINAMETPFIAEQLEHWVKDLSVELVLEALGRAVKYEAGYGYAERIMKEWAKKNVDTIEKVQQADAAFEQKNTKRYQKSNYKPKPDENLPDWAKENHTDPDELVTEEDKKDLDSRLERLKQLRERRV